MKKYKRFPKTMIFTLFIAVMLCSFASPSFAVDYQSNPVDITGIVVEPQSNPVDIPDMVVDLQSDPADIPDVVVDLQSDPVDIPDTAMDLRSNPSIITIGSGEAEIAIPSLQTTSTPSASQVTIHVIYNLRLNTTTKKMWGEYKWDRTNGNPPPANVGIRIALYSTRGALSESAKTFPKINKGQLYSTPQCSIHTDKWQFYAITTVTNVQGKTKEYYNYDPTTKQLYNKACVKYPTYTDQKSGKVLAEPALNWTKVSNPVSWTDTDRKKYRKWYENNYNNGRAMDWSNLQIHHMRPRAYGGTNNYDNLIVVSTSVHQELNGWWNNY